MNTDDMNLVTFKFSNTERRDAMLALALDAESSVSFGAKDSEVLRVYAYVNEPWLAIELK